MRWDELEMLVVVVIIAYLQDSQVPLYLTYFAHFLCNTYRGIALSTFIPRLVLWLDTPCQASDVLILCNVCPPSNGSIPIQASIT